MEKIYCDESGFTGQDLLEDSQPYFVYSAVRLNDLDKEAILKLIRDNYHLQANEIKGKHLVQNSKGQQTIIKLFEQHGSKARMVYHDKKFALAGKIFEYAIEPYIEANQRIYESGFHKFIATGLYVYFMKQKEDAEQLFKSFLHELRGNRTDAVADFDHSGVDYSILYWVFEIIKSNPEIFYNEVQTARSVDRWILDLTTTSLSVLLTEWSKNGDSLSVVCDNSKVLADSEIIDGMNETGRMRSRAKILDQNFGFSLSQDITLGDSKNEVGLQIADLFSSALAFSLNHRDIDFSRRIYERFVAESSCKPNTYCIVPDFEMIQNKEKLNLYEEIMKGIWLEQWSVTQS